MYGSDEQFSRVECAIRTAQFIRNSVIARWIYEGQKPKELRKYGKYDMNTDSSILAKTYVFCGRLNSQARQASAERGWASVSRYYANCKNSSINQKGYPKFKKNSRSVEYKTTGWKFGAGTKQITFTDKLSMGTFTLRGGRYLTKEMLPLIKRVRIVRKSDKYYLQVCFDMANKREVLPSTGKAIGIDLGLKEFYTGSDGSVKENHQFLKKSEKILKKVQRQMSRCKKGSNNRRKRKARLTNLHARVANQRKDFCDKAARNVVMSNDVVVLEKLRIFKMVKGRFAKSINDSAWGAFRTKVEYYAKLYNRTVLFVDPAGTTQACNACGCLPSEKITLNIRTYECEHCGLILDRDLNASINILQFAYFATAGHAESRFLRQCVLDSLTEAKKLNVFGELTSAERTHLHSASRLVEKETTIQVCNKKNLKTQQKVLEPADNEIEIQRHSAMEDVKRDQMERV